MSDATRNPLTISPRPEQTHETHTFDVNNQNKLNTADFVNAFMSAIHKRSKHLRVSPFVGLSSGYDSGAIACALASSLVPTHAYTVLGLEKQNIISSRLSYMAEKNALSSSRTIDMSDSEYKQQSSQLFELCEEYLFPANLGSFEVVRVGEQMDMRLDPGAIGLSRVCHLAREDSSLVYFSGTGADEIISDYGFNGHKYTPHSSFGGNFPDDLSTVYPWYNFFGGTQRAYLMKEEMVAGSYGIEVRYPFLDLAVVQEFLWLHPAVKNSEYKRPIADV